MISPELEGGLMKSATSIAAALMFSFGIAAHAQEAASKSKTNVKDGDSQPVTFIGCVQTAAETRTYILEKVAPVSRTTTTETTGTSGAVTTTSTTYALVPGEKVELQTHVGRKAEATGIVIPAGDSKTKTKTKIEREGEPDAKVKEKTKTDSDRPKLQVVSVKPLQEPC
jgi:hypothetical protein